ncbi:DUF6615 family protein [Microbulbifer sp. YPW1]|uniref:DUF6615 family protein n=1 Tax=Microbulbifer sp. YPW1 TaxID=2745199 RepID=UPI00351A61C1
MLQTILEDLARDSSARFRDSQILDIRFGEETITDLVLLELKRLSPQNVLILQTSKAAEASTGTDWEWWIGSDRVGWTRYAVQAKKMNWDTERYNSITQRTGSKLQIDVLDAFAASNGAIPLYCFYNSATSTAKSAWNCCKAFDAPQLACTVTPSAIVRPCISTRGTKNFSWMHSHIETVPWRCLTCPTTTKRYQRWVTPEPLDANESSEEEKPLDSKVQRTNVPDSPPRRSAHYETLPRVIREARQRGRLEQFPYELYDDNQSYPRRILVLESSVEDEARGGVQHGGED